MDFPLFIDIAIVAILVGYAFDGYRRGFLLLLVELFGTVLSFYLAFRFSQPVGAWISGLFTVPEAMHRIVGFFVLWIGTEILYFAVTSYLYQFIPKFVRESLFNKVVGVIPSVAKGLVALAIVLTLITALPVQTPLRPAITDSQLGQPIVEQTQLYQQRLMHRYEAQITETLTFLTTTPVISQKIIDHETIKLHFTTADGTVDPKSEAAMLTLVNQERAKVGLKPLVADAKLREVARAHAKDMLERGYFAHNTPEGIDPFDRMDAAGIAYLTAGENLAFAPTLNLAHIGLMNSPKHKENILYPPFGKAGIGVIDAGIYGKMFVQEFSN